MKRAGIILKHLLIIGLLTLFTQIGGVLWLIHIPLHKRLARVFNKTWKITIARLLSFCSFYLFFTLWIVPPLAKWQCGRVPLPVWSNPKLRPHNVFYYALLNHHYVRPALKRSVEDIAEKLSKKYPGSVLCYLDANFPFIDGYPLEPHFTHRDGKKLDIALYWKNVESGAIIFGTPSILGYGAAAEPKSGEVNYDEKCRKQGNWYRNHERDYLGHFDKSKYVFDETISREMIKLFAEDSSVKSILLEPHLKTRLGLEKYTKIRFQGCRAARHDDHIHIQLR